jgi:hypothetical protein
MKQEGSAKTGKRISFLMPYIDFCFMLIIIFVGMLSIAYFEPLGATNMESKQDKTPDDTTGIHEAIPPGIETRRAGTGVVTDLGTPKPLVSRETQQRMLYPTPNPAPSPNPVKTKSQPAAPETAGGVNGAQQTGTGTGAGTGAAGQGGAGQTAPGQTPQSGQTGQGRAEGTGAQQGGQPQLQSPVSAREAADLLEKLKKMQEEIEKLKARQGEPPKEHEGISNHLYLDLRNGQK